MRSDRLNSPFWLAAFALAGSVVFAPVLPAESFEDFTIEKIRGDSCQIRAEGASDWTKASEGMKERSGAAGKTGAGSTMTVAFDAKNRFRLMPKTELVISTSTRDAKFQKVIDLTMGAGKVEVELDALPEKHQFKVQTPTAVCGAVGTRFEVSSDDSGGNHFESSKGTIFAASRQDGSFYAGRIQAGQSVDAQLSPGKENSYSRVKVAGGKMPVSFGSRSGAMDLSDGSAVAVAQERADDTRDLALKVERGAAGGKGPGRYVMKSGTVESLADDKAGSGIFDDYLDLARQEGEARAELQKKKESGAPSSEISALERRLEELADRATAKRKELFQHRDQIRRVLRSGTDAIRSMPTTIPGGARGPR